jgi:hypothetical protein
MSVIYALCCSLLLVTVTFAQRSGQEARALIGTWRVVEFADLDKDGKWQYWYGEHPRGLRCDRARAYSDHESSTPGAISRIDLRCRQDALTRACPRSLHRISGILRHLHRGCTEARSNSSCRRQPGTGLHQYRPAASLQIRRRPVGDRRWKSRTPSAGACALILRSRPAYRVDAKKSSERDGECFEQQPIQE